MKRPGVLGGDFNVVRYTDERLNRNRNDRERQEFNNLVSNMSLIEVLLADRLYTRFSIRENRSLAKLDRVFILEGWDGKFGLTMVFSIRRPTSNHMSICLSSGETRKKLRRIFRFEKW